MRKGIELHEVIYEEYGITSNSNALYASIQSCIFDNFNEGISNARFMDFSKL